jgi:DNA-binding GntR family transcriptional regulator
VTTRNARAPHTAAPHTTPGRDRREGGLAADRARLERTSTAERVADILRGKIVDGWFRPGERLSEDAIGGELGISRNTLREAFRLLTHERLLVHELNRGVFVRVLTDEDLADVFRVRRLVECAAVRALAEPPHPPAAPGALDALDDAVEAGARAVRDHDWQALSTANIRFHQGIVALTGSPRTEDLMRGVFAELRLVFHVMPDPRSFYEPYLARNREIRDALRAGDPARAERLLAAYLDDSRAQLTTVYAAARPR